MAAYALYVLKRFGQFVLVVFVGINIAFFVTHATPIDPIMAAIAAATRFSQSDPQAVQMTREALRELYGLQGSLWQQYVAFWMRVAVADFGPSLSAFPTPVSTLIWRAMPWTFGLLSIATLISWGLGNLLGGLAGYYRRNVWLKLFGVAASGLQPIPNYVMAFVYSSCSAMYGRYCRSPDQRRLTCPAVGPLLISRASSNTDSCRSSRWCSWERAPGSSGCARSSPTSLRRTTSPTPNSAASTTGAS
jgi:ABC-type dipeptide/oligopeptide/nickel transport system permease component